MKRIETLDFNVCSVTVINGNFLVDALDAMDAESELLSGRSKYSMLRAERLLLAAPKRKSGVLDKGNKTKQNDDRT